MILEHLDKNNFHHAYLIEGQRDKIIPEIIKFCESLGINTVGNPDFCRISIDNFKIDEALDLRALSSQKGFSSDKKIFIICVNSFSLDAEGVLLKIFEEPIENTHFFLIVPDTNALLKTLVSRFYLIKAAPMPKGIGAPTESVGEKFISLPLQKRVDFIKELLVEIEEEDAEGNEIAVLDSTRSKALKFLNALEFVLNSKLVKQNSLQICLQHFFKVREFLRMPGSSVKSLMESVALITPSML
jgi:DNA polymerase III delta prime subunit